MTSTTVPMISAISPDPSRNRMRNGMEVLQLFRPEERFGNPRASLSIPSRSVSFLLVARSVADPQDEPFPGIAPKWDGRLADHSRRCEKSLPTRAECRCACSRPNCPCG